MLEFCEIPPKLKAAKSHVVTSTMSNPFKKETRRRNWMNFLESETPHSLYLCVFI